MRRLFYKALISVCTIGLYQNRIFCLFFFEEFFVQMSSIFRLFLPEIAYALGVNHIRSFNDTNYQFIPFSMFINIDISSK